MQREFQIIDLSLMKFFLRIEVEKIEKGIFICKKKYAMYIFTRFMMTNCKPTSTPIPTRMKLGKEYKSPSANPTLYKKLVGSLMYLTGTMPNIMYVVNLIYRFMESPKDSHWRIGKIIL